MSYGANEQERAAYRLGLEKGLVAGAAMATKIIDHIEVMQ